MGQLSTNNWIPLRIWVPVERSTNKTPGWEGNNFHKGGRAWASPWGKEYMVCLRARKSPVCLENGTHWEGQWGRRLERKDGARSWRFLNREGLDFASVRNWEPLGQKRNLFTSEPYKIHLLLTCMKKWIGTVKNYTSFGEVGVKITVIKNNLYWVSTMYPALVPSSTLHAVVQIVIAKDRHFLQLTGAQLRPERIKWYAPSHTAQEWVTDLRSEPKSISKMNALLLESDFFLFHWEARINGIHKYLSLLWVKGLEGVLMLMFWI